jgi:hypothetical protein
MGLLSTAAVSALMTAVLAIYVRYELICAVGYADLVTLLAREVARFVARALGSRCACSWTW